MGDADDVTARLTTAFSAVAHSVKGLSAAVATLTRSLRTLFPVTDRRIARRVARREGRRFYKAGKEYRFR